MAKILVINASPDGSILETPLGPLANLYANDEELLAAVKTLEWSALSTAQEPSNWKFVGEPAKLLKENEKPPVVNLGTWRDLPMKIRTI